MLDVINSIWSILSLHSVENPWFYRLLLLMAGDIFTGFMRAWQERCLNSAVAGKGFRVKALMLMFVLIASYFESGQAVQASEYIATMFCVSELISIFENAAKMNFPGVEVLWRVFGGFFGRFEYLPNSFSERSESKHDTKQYRGDTFNTIIEAAVSKDGEENTDATGLPVEPKPSTTG